MVIKYYAFKSRTHFTLRVNIYRLKRGGPAQRGDRAVDIFTNILGDINVAQKKLLSPSRR